MKVLKFGGTSVGTVESLTNVKQIVESRQEPVVVVVSALGGLTDQLIATANKASTGDPNYISNCAQMAARHHAIIQALVPDAQRAAVHQRIDGLMDELSSFYTEINSAETLSQRMLDKVVSMGERMSSCIISHIIAGAQLMDSREFIRTRHLHGKHMLNADETHWLIHKHFNNAKAPVIIVPGFIASDAQGNVTNLGRGGSDYTASILAASLGADLLEIWTDVDGFLTADPRIIPTAKLIDRMTYGEAMELCNFGAKVIYPPTIYPVFNKNIPIVIKNTFNPSHPGTFISHKLESPRQAGSPCGESSISDTCLVTLRGTAIGEKMDTGARIFNALAPYGVGIYFMNKVGEEESLSLVVRNNEADTAVAVLSKEFDDEIEEITIKRKLATIALVGDNLKSGGTLPEEIFSLLHESGIRLYAYTSGADMSTFAIVVELDRLKEAMNLLHDSLFAE